MDGDGGPGGSALRCALARSAPRLNPPPQKDGRARACGCADSGRRPHTCPCARACPGPARAAPGGRRRLRWRAPRCLRRLCLAPSRPARCAAGLRFWAALARAADRPLSRNDWGLEVGVGRGCALWLRLGGRGGVGRVARPPGRFCVALPQAGAGGCGRVQGVLMRRARAVCAPLRPRAPLHLPRAVSKKFSERRRSSVSFGSGSSPLQGARRGNRLSPVPPSEIRFDSFGASPGAFLFLLSAPAQNQRARVRECVQADERGFSLRSAFAVLRAWAAKPRLAAPPLFPSSFQAGQSTIGVRPRSVFPGR